MTAYSLYLSNQLCCITTTYDCNTASTLWCVLWGIQYLTLLLFRHTAERLYFHWLVSPASQILLELLWEKVCFNHHASHILFLPRLCALHKHICILQFSCITIMPAPPPGTAGAFSTLQFMGRVFSCLWMSEFNCSQFMCILEKICVFFLSLFLPEHNRAIKMALRVSCTKWVNAFLFVDSNMPFIWANIFAYQQIKGSVTTCTLKRTFNKCEHGLYRKTMASKQCISITLVTITVNLLLCLSKECSNNPELISLSCSLLICSQVTVTQVVSLLKE